MERDVTIPGVALSGRTILIVEDEPLIVLEVQDAFHAAGARIVSAARIKDALEIIDKNDLSAAVVDINLGGQDCGAVCERLAERKIPFVLYTGQARPEVLLRWPEAPVLTKLADMQKVLAVVAGILR
jgi:DNA-binding response OmpR family regulator